MSDEREIAEARVGTVLNDKWTLEHLLGVGGMAAVYAARHRNEARAAVKILHRELGQHPSIRERFVREGYAANRVEHADVVKVLDDDVIQGGTDDGTPFLVMELLEGQSLEDRVRSGPPLGEEELFEILRSVLSVLESAHPKGIIHRDLKPENLFLVGDGKVKVLDFGIARTIESRGLTMHGLPMGTPAFMAPEQAAGRVDEIDGRTDLFALGATGFNVLSGRTVHEGDNTLEVMSRMAKEQAPPLRSVAPGVSEPCAHVIDRALMLHREDRYESATTMREDVEEALRELRSKQALPVIDSSRETPVPPRRGGGCLSWLLVLVVLSAAGVVAFRVWGTSRIHPLPATPDAALAPDVDAAPAVDASVVPVIVEDAAPSVEDAATTETDAGELDADFADVEEIDASVALLDASSPPPRPVTTVHAHPVPVPVPAPHPKPKPKPHH